MTGEFKFHSCIHNGMVLVGCTINKYGGVYFSGVSVDGNHWLVNLCTVYNLKEITINDPAAIKNLNQKDIRNDSN